MRISRAGSSSRWKLAIGFVALLTLLAACGGSGDGAGGSSPTGSGTEGALGPAPSKSEIKIGVVTSVTGSTASSYAGVIPTATAWAKWVNKTQGGINGHPVSIVTSDTKGDAAATLSGGQQFIRDNGVVATIVADSQAESVLAGPFETAGLPVIGGSSVDTRVQGVSPIVFTTGSMNPYYEQGEVQAAKAKGATKLASLVCAESPVCAQINKVFDASASKVGLDFVGGVAVAASAPNYTAPCLSLIDKGADFVAAVVAGAVLSRIVKDCNAQGYKGMYGVFGQSVLQPVFENLDGLSAAGTLTGFPWWSTAAPVQKYLEVAEQYMSKDEWSKKVWANPSATNVWASLELFRKAMSGASDSPTRTEVVDNYHKVSDETLGGLLPKAMTFTAGQPAPKVNCFWNYAYKDGRFSTIPPDGSAGNGASGDLASTCYSLD